MTENDRSSSNWFRRWGIGVTISVLALIAAFWGFQPKRLVEVLVQGAYGYLVPAMGVLVIGLIFRALSWQTLLLNEVSFRRAFAALNQGYLANNALPLRIGEFVRAYAVSYDQSLGILKAFPSVIVERIIDIFFALLFLMLSLITLVLPAWSRNIAQFATVFLVVGLILVAMLVWKGDRLTSFLMRVPIPGLPGLAQMSDEFVGALQRMVASKRALAKALALLGLAWVTVWVQFWFIGQVYGVELGVTELMFATSITALGAAIPASPGAIGVFEFAAVSGLMVLGVSREVALSMAVLWHGMQLVTTSVFGAATLAKDSRSIGELGAQAQAFYATLREPSA